MNRRITQSTKRKRLLRPSVLLDKDHIVLLTERVTQRAEISPVIMRLCLLPNTKSGKLMLVNFKPSKWLHLGIKFTFFVALDTSESMKRKHFWGRYWGGVIGSWYWSQSEASNSHQTLPTLNTDRCKVRKHQGKSANFQFVFVHNTTLVEVLELWVLRTISGLPEERFALGR